MDEVQQIGAETTTIPGPRVQDIRVDGAGDHRCWRCGSRGLVATLRAGAIIAQRTSSAVATQVDCGTCGAQNDLTNPRPTH